MVKPLPVLAAWSLGGGELLIILLIVLVLFGGSRLASMGKGLGQSIKEFKKAVKDEDDPAKVEAKKPDSHGSN